MTKRGRGDRRGFHPAPSRVEVLAQPRPFQCIPNILTNELRLGDMRLGPLHIFLLEGYETEIPKGSDFAMPIPSLQEEISRPHAELGSLWVVPLVELHVRHVS